jgi:cytochrome c-type biogenesis protein
VFKLGVLGRTAQWQIREKPAGYAGSLAVGVTFAIGTHPRRHPVARGNDRHHATGDGTPHRLLRGPRTAVSPLLGGARVLPQRVHTLRRWIPIVERVAGVLLVVVGIMVYTNYFLVLTSWALSLTPDWLLRRL